jgi:nucleoside-diphosphate-sugar epimerase
MRPDGGGSAGAVLVTGAGGYLGGRIAALASGRGGRGRVVALDRAAADLTKPGALDAVDPRGVTHVVHAAAVTRFGVDRSTAAAVNAEGTRQVIEFARRCPDLDRLMLLSTLYTAGQRAGEIAEEAHEPAGFANYYEWSKHAAERIVLDSGVPAIVARVATIAADDDSGHVTQHNAVHNTLKLFYYGLLSLMPGSPETPLPLATADFTMAAIASLLGWDDGGAGAAEPGVYQLCTDPEQTATLGQLVGAAYAVFEQEPAFRRRGILPPLCCDEEAFGHLRAGARSLRAGPVHDALESVAPFAAQLYRPKTFANTRLHKAWPGYAAPDPVHLVTATVDCLVRTRWGRAG